MDATEKAYRELADLDKKRFIEGRDRKEPGLPFPGGFGTVYDADDVYQTQLKTDQHSGLWLACLSLGIDEWDWLTAQGAAQIWVVNSRWNLTHKVTDLSKVYDRREDTKMGKRFLIPEKRWRVK